MTTAIAKSLDFGVIIVQNMPIQTSRDSFIGACKLASRISKIYAFISIEIVQDDRIFQSTAVVDRDNDFLS